MSGMKNTVTRKIGVDMGEFVYVLSCYDCRSGEDSEILGVFKEHEDAVTYKNEYIREMFDIEEEILDKDLDDEIDGIEFNVERHIVK